MDLNNLPKIEFKELVKLSTTDLLTYNPTDLNVMADYMGVSAKNSTELASQIAQKIVSINSQSIPNCECASTFVKKRNIQKLRSQIYKKYHKFKDSVTNMEGDDLAAIFKDYDADFFNNKISEKINDNGYTLGFKTNGTRTFTTEGICAFDKCDYTITIPVDIFKTVNGATNVAGHICYDQLECLLRVIEHELVHLIIFIFCKDTFVTDQHGPLFQNLINQIFGHTDIHHYIITGRSESR